MKKIYLVKAQKLVDLKEEIPTSFNDEVFTNKKLAEAYITYWNTAPKHEYHYWIVEYEICKADYTSLIKLHF